MCGIVGYIGERQAQEILIKGLSRLEYRGYDSAGIAIVNDGLAVRKKSGKIAKLSESLDQSPLRGCLGIGHTRWATHGPPNDVNAHPHESTDGSFALVHNGIIENYTSLRDMLSGRGYTFSSQTDTEVLVRLIEDVHKRTGLSLGKAVRQALSQVHGTYGIALVSRDDPDMLIAARKGSPLILGVGEDEYFLGSDAAPIIEYTRKVVYLNDGELVVIRRNGFKVFSVDEVKLNKKIHELEWDLEQIEKGGFEHFMLKEIMEQPDSLENAMRGRLYDAEPWVQLGGLMDAVESLRNASRIVICACGTSWHAALVGEYLIESLVRIPVEVEYASEFRYRNPILRPDDAVLVISQSGETADTLAAVREAQSQNVPVYGICNTVGSTIARETDAGVYLHAGPEIGVASTKAFTAQVTVLAQIALRLGCNNTLDDAQMSEYVTALRAIPAQIKTVLKNAENIESIAKLFPIRIEFSVSGSRSKLSCGPRGSVETERDILYPCRGLPRG